MKNLQNILFLATAAIISLSFRSKSRIAGNLPNSSIDTTPGTLRSEFPDSVFSKPEIAPQFPGGNGAWKKFIQKNLDGATPLRNKAPAGKYTLIVEFTVNKDGSPSEIRALTKHGYGMEREAIRLIKSSPGWKPAIDDGRIVRASQTQTITFIVAGYGFQSQ